MAIDVDSGVLCPGFGRGVRVVGSGNFGRFSAFLALWRASTVCRLAIKVTVSLGIAPEWI